MCLSCRCSGQLPDAARLPLSAFLYSTNIQNISLKVKCFTHFFITNLFTIPKSIPLILLHFPTKTPIFEINLEDTSARCEIYKQARYYFARLFVSLPY